MNKSMESFDPELQGLLAEIAVGGKSEFLRGSPADRKRVIFPTERKISANAAWLSKAERHLLRVHREELERLLYNYAQERLLEDLVFGPSINPSHTIERELRLPGTAEWNRRAEIARDRDPEEYLRPAQSLLGRLCSNGEHATPRQTLEACLRVIPSARAKVTLAVDRIRTGQDSEAETILRKVLGDTPSSMIRSYAWQNLGLIECGRRDYDRAVTAYATSTDATDERVAPLTSLFFMAMQAGRLDDAVRAGSRLDERIEPTHSAVQSLVARSVSLRGARRLPSKAFKMTASERDTLGRVGNEIMKDAFQ